MSINIDRFEVYIEFSRKFYKIFSLNINKQKKELCYHFSYPEGTKKRYFSVNEQRETGRIDHITFHNDGRVHLSLRRENLKLGGNTFCDNVFLSTDKKITPLLLHSIYSFNDGYSLYAIDAALKKDFQKRSMSCYTYNLYKFEALCDFSVIIFLTPKEIVTEEILNRLCFHTTIGNLPAKLLCCSALRIDAYDGWAIDCCLFPNFVLNLCSNKYFFSFTFQDINKFIDLSCDL